MIGAMFNRAGPIGLDIGSRSIKAVQCRRANGVWQASAYARIDRGEPGRPLSSAEAARTAGILQRQGFVGNRCVIAAEQSGLLSAAMELPPRASGAPLETIAAGELARANKCDAGGLSVGVWDLPAQAGPKPGATAMAVGARLTDIETALAALESAGLDVEAVDVQALALVRAWHALSRPAGVALDIGASGVLVAAWVSGALVFQRHLAEHSQSALIEALRNAMGVDEESVLVIAAEQASRGAGAWEGLEDAAAAVDQHADALAREVRLSLSYISQRFSALGGNDPILVSGGGASFPGLTARLGSALATTVQHFASPALGMVPESQVGALAVALGLALPAERSGA